MLPQGAPPAYDMELSVSFHLGCPGLMSLQRTSVRTSDKGHVSNADMEKELFWWVAHSCLIKGCCCCSSNGTAKAL